MRRTAAAAALCAVGLTVVAAPAAATVHPRCSATGLDLEWYDFKPGPHAVTWSIDGHVPPTTIVIRNGDITHVNLPHLPPWSVVTVRERWGTPVGEAIQFDTQVRCVGTPPGNTTTTPPPVPPTAPEPPTGTTPQPPVTPPPAPRPRPNCLSRPKPGPRWCPPRRPKPPINCRVVPRPGPRWCPPLRIPPAVPVPNPAG